MPFIEIITDLKSKERLKRIFKNNNLLNRELLFIKKRNLKNIRNVKLETIVIDKYVEYNKIIKQIIDNSKYIIINEDYNKRILEKLKLQGKKNIITYGYCLNSDITISSIENNELILYIQNRINSIFNKKIEKQEVKMNIKSDLNVYNIMLIIAITSLYA